MGEVLSATFHRVHLYDEGKAVFLTFESGDLRKIQEFRAVCRANFPTSPESLETEHVVDLPRGQVFVFKRPDSDAIETMTKFICDDLQLGWDNYLTRHHDWILPPILDVYVPLADCIARKLL